MRKFSLKHLYSKRVILTFAGLYSLLVILGSTFAWITTSNTRVNEFRGDGRFETMIVETFTPDMEWQPGLETIKEVRIYNAGSIPAFVRLSFEEILTVYGIRTGKGDLGNVTTISNGEYKAWLYDDFSGQLYGQDGSNNDINRSTVLLNFISLQFGTVKTSDQTPPITPYWLYDNGYFYYSEALDSGSYTDPLLKSVTISAEAPNLIKNGDYQVDIKHNSIQAGSGTLSAWGITSGPVFDMLNS